MPEFRSCGTLVAESREPQQGEQMLDTGISALLLSSFILMVILSYINYKILNITIYMLEVTIDIRDVSLALLRETEKFSTSFIMKE